MRRRSKQGRGEGEGEEGGGCNELAFSRLLTRGQPAFVSRCEQTRIYASYRQAASKKESSEGAEENLFGLSSQIHKTAHVLFLLRQNE